MVSPPEIAAFKLPATPITPSEIPLMIVALLPKIVEPAPDKVVTVTVPELPLKFTFPALATVPTLSPVPEMSAAPSDPTESVAAEL